MPKHEKYRILAQEATKSNAEYIQPPEERNEEILHCQEYLRDVRVDEKWDCETILSTYSTMENHPTVINDVLKPTKKDRGDGSLASGMSQSNKQNNTPTKIVLSGKFNMPIEYVAGYKGGKDKSGSTDTASLLSSSSTNRMYSRNRNKLIDLVETHVMEKGLKKMSIAKEEDGDDDVVMDGRSKGDKSGNADDGETSVLKRTLLRKETAEEKRERKANVKAERRDKRVAKKEMKKAYTNESNEQSRIASRQQNSSAPKGLSVFKYTL